MEKITAYLIGGKVFSNDKKGINLNSRGTFGTKDSEKVYFSPSEAFYLYKKSLLRILDHKDKSLNEKDFQKRLNTLDKNFKNKFLVYKDLRNQGLIPKEALKFGTDFRLYKNKKDSHSTWLVKVESSKSIKTNALIANTRIANTSKKNLLLAIVDDENKVTYIETKRIKP